MTDQEINEAIARRCGWTKSALGWWSQNDRGRAYTDPPDFCHDLNAMHEAECSLSREQETYQQELHDVVVRGKEGLTIGDFWYLQIHATARQRAEAFLRAIGEWKE